MKDKNEEIILKQSDTLLMLDRLLEDRENEWWDNFYMDRIKPIPFFQNIPDNNLVELLKSNHFTPKTALDIGCGNGRNAFYLASKDIQVTAIDFSDISIEWAIEKQKKSNGISDDNPSFISTSFFTFEAQENDYDLIYDSGCLHHIKPHRRSEYLEKIASLLKSNGIFALNCFNLKGGANISDYEVYQNNSMRGGLGYSKEKLTKILEEYFEIISFTDMKASENQKTLSLDILWNVVMRLK